MLKNLRKDAGLTSESAGSTQKSCLRFDLVVWTIIIFGAALRIATWIKDPSLFIDEAMLARSIIEREFSELAEPLDFGQGAPYGFLLAAKFCTVLFGTGEMALRLVPLASGLASLVFFSAIVHRCLLNLTAKAVAVAMFAVSGGLVSWSAEFKPYAVDVLAALALVWSTTQLINRGFEFRDILLIAIIGTLAVWCSIPSVFVLAGCGIAILSANMKWSERPKQLMALCQVGALIAVNEWAHYILVLSRVAEKSGEGYWTSGFVSLGANFASDLWRIFTHFLHSSFGLRWFASDSISSLILAMMAIGCVSLIKRRNHFAQIGLGVVATAVVAAALQIYSLKDRLTIFLVPFAIIFFVAGADVVSDFVIRGKQYMRWFLLPLISCLIIIPNIERVVELLRRLDTSRSVYAELARQRRTGDLLFVEANSRPAFLYYAPRFGLGNWPYEVVSPYTNYKQVKGARAWVVITHTFSKSPTMRVDLERILAERGAKLITHFRFGTTENKGGPADAWLYEVL